MQVKYEKGDLVARPIMITKGDFKETHKGGICCYLLGIKTEKKDIYDDVVIITTAPSGNFAKYCGTVSCVGGFPKELHPDGCLNLLLTDEVSCPPGYTDTYVKVVQEKSERMPLNFLSRQRKDISGCVKDARDYAIAHDVEVSIDLYYNDLADYGRQFVAKVHSYANHIPTAHFRYQDFWLAASSAHEYVYEAVNHYCECNKK